MQLGRAVVADVEEQAAEMGDREALNETRSHQQMKKSCVENPYLTLPQAMEGANTGYVAGYFQSRRKERQVQCR